MLLDFTVANYRSIKEPVTLSAVAQKQRRVQSSENGNRKRVKSDNEIAPAYSLEDWNVEVLPVLGIFGANASGKSNIVKALDCLLLIMKFGNNDDLIKDSIKHTRITPFSLDDFTSKQPTYFELRFFGDDAVYTYSLSLNKTQIFSETLNYEPSTTHRSRCLFQRIWNHETKSFQWKYGRDFLGAHLQLSQNLENNEFFITVLNRLSLKEIRPIQDLINFSILIGSFYREMYHRDEALVRTISSRIPLSHELFRRSIQILKKFDTGIFDIEIKEDEDVEGEYKIYSLHKSQDNNLIRWSFEEESLGTQRLLELTLRTMLILDMGLLMIVDEISANIHPNITKEIIRLFQSPTTNPKRAQLIFTSHDNTLQRNNVLRRDQIWFTQKRPDHSTDLYPLTDFKVRNDLAIDKAYLDGRFGAVPILPSEDELLAGVDDE